MMNETAVQDTMLFFDWHQGVYPLYHENRGRHPADKNGVWSITEKLAVKHEKIDSIASDLKKAARFFVYNCFYTANVWQDLK